MKLYRTRYYVLCNMYRNTACCTVHHQYNLFPLRSTNKLTSSTTGHLPSIVIHLSAAALWVQQIARVDNHFDEDGVVLQIESFALVLQHFLLNKHRTATGNVHRHRWLLEAGARRVGSKRVRQVAPVVLLVQQH